MKNLLPWLKAHWPIPLLTLIALAVLPTAWWFADDMRTKDNTAFQERVKKDADSVSANAANVSYYIPNSDGSGKFMEKTAPANEAMIKHYGEMWSSIEGKIGGVSEKGIKFNQGDHKLLIEGLFPPPANDQVQTANLGRSFVERDIQFHQQLLAGMKAGEPTKPDDIAKQLIERRDAEIARVKAELNRDLDAAEQTKLTEELVALRVAAVRKRAGEIGVYADPSIFVGLPTSVPVNAPSPSQAWDMQERAWIDQDICHAVSLANAHATAGVADAVVKRITKISISPSAYDSGSDRAPQANPFDSGDDKPPLDFSASITGRVSGPGRKNKWYDVRPVTIEVIVASQKLPQLLDALAATNFITVIDLDLARVEPLADVHDGYDYGDENVVRASIALETIWLRDWRAKAMPPDVKLALGMVSEGEGGAPAAAAPPPPPLTSRPPPGGGRINSGAGGRGGRPPVDRPD